MLGVWKWAKDNSYCVTVYVINIRIIYTIHCIRIYQMNKLYRYILHISPVPTYIRQIILY
jgi:hypothetical protein